MAATVAVLGVPLAGGVSAGADDQDLAVLGQSADPAVLDLVREAMSTQERATERRESPEAAAEREDSRTAYDDLGRAEALDVAKDAFGDVIATPAWEPLDLPPGAEIEGFDSHDTQARVDIPGESADAVVQSTLPLRGETSSGTEAPADLSLQDDGGADFEPKAPLVETAIPARLEEGATLQESGIEFAPADAEEAASARVSGDTAFYANLDQDADAALQPAPTGAHMLFQLRSADSPEQLEMSFELPTGATLEQGGPLGGAQIMRDGEPVGQVTQPLAFDADGWPVELTHRVEGDRLVIEIPHRSQDLAYPILVDPVVVESQPDLEAEHIGWRGTSTPRISTFAADGFLETKGVPGTYGANEAAGWFFDSPGPEVHIYSFAFDALIVAQHKSLTVQGAYAPSSSDFDDGTLHGASASLGSTSPLSYGFNIWSAIQHCFGANIYCIGGTKGNSIWNVQWSTGTSHTGTFRNLISGAGVWLFDQTRPTLGDPQHMTNGQLGLPTGWVGDDEITSVINAKDRGLGVKRYELTVPGEPSPRIRTNSCEGNRLDRCPNDDSFHPSDGADGETLSGDPFTYDTSSIPEGTDQTITARAQDFNDNWSEPQTWKLKVDHTAPQVVLDGQLYERAGTELGRADYGLQVDATDGSGQTPQSGVSSIEVSVDGEREVFVDQPCPDGSCSMSDSSYEFAAPTFDPGQHAIEVRVTDQAGNAASEAFHVTVPVILPPETLIDVGVRGFAPSSDARFEFHASEADSSFRCRLDEALWEPCSSPMAYEGLEDGDHSFDVQATDPWANDDPSPARRNWTIDTVPPDTTLVSGPSGATSDSTPTFTFSGNEEGVTFECRIDSTAFVGCGGIGNSYTAAPLGDGAHTFVVRARDRAANLDGSPATRGFNVDTVPPQASITGGTTNTVFADTADFAFTASESGSQFQCSLDFGAWQGCTSVTAYSRIGEGDHLFAVRARDAAGNYSVRPAARVWTRERQGSIQSNHPSSPYSHDGNCGGNKVDPVGVVFEGRTATFNNVREAIRAHIPGWDHWGEGKGQWVRVLADDANGAQCMNPQGDTATHGGPPAVDRYHVRLWPVPKSQGHGQNHKKVVGTPHFDDARGFPPHHCIPEDGFNRGRRHLWRLFREAKHSTDYPNWGNTAKTSHCGEDIRSNGNVAIIGMGHDH